VGRGSAARGTGDREGPRLTSEARRPAPPAFPAWFEPLADAATLALLAVYFVSLAGHAGGARLQTDECFHATVSQWIAAHGTLPRSIPELYGGFAYFYPPLFHLLGAAWIKLFGADAFRFVNVFVTALLVAWLALGRGAPGVWNDPVRRSARRWAILLCVANGWLTFHALRLYVEQLTALLAVGTVLLALEVRRDPRRWTVVGLGLTVGLAVLAKQSSLVLVGLLVALAAGFAVRRERPVARAFAAAAGIALLIAAPIFVRNAVLFGSPVYPALAPDRHLLLYELNRRNFTPDPLDFYRATATHTGWAIGAMALGALGLAVAWRQVTLAAALIGFCVLLYLGGPLQPLLDPRHMLPVIAMAATLAAIESARLLAARPAWRAGVSVALILLAARAVAPMPNYRGSLDIAPALLQALEESGRRVPEGETILSPWTYDTWYYARRPATWPIPWSQPAPPFEMFMTADSDSVLLALRHHRLRYVLVPTRAKDAPFDGVSYPLSFVRSVGTLLEQERVELLWASAALGLIRVPEADSAGASR